MTHMRRYSLAALLLPAALTALAAQEAPQAPRPGVDQPAVTFRVEVNYVEVDAAVFDRAGRFVRDLRREDFQVLEDGEPQEVTTFSLVDIPVVRAEQPLFAASPIPPDTMTNERPFDGRLYVLVLDDLHTAAFRTAQVRRAARQFIERHMAANDMAAVVHTSGRSDAAQEFTSDKRLLLASVDKFIGRKLRSQTLERLDEYQRQRNIPTGPSGQGNTQNRIGDPLDMQRGYDARNSLEVLQNVSAWVNNIRGRRKAIVLLSEGIDYNIYDFNNRDATTVQDGMREVIASATRANVSIYAVDPRGLTGMGEESIEAAGGFPEDPNLGLSMQSFQDDLRLAQINLRSLAEDTGGYAAVNQNDFTGAWERVVNDNSSYYVLGYYPTNDRRDGRFRKIEVKLVGRQGLEVRSRKGYTAPKGKPPAPTRAPADDKTSPELRQALDSPLPLPAITMRAFAVPFRGAAPNASVAVAVEVEGADINFQAKDGKFVNDFEVAAIAVGSDGKVKDGDRSLLNMGLKPETRARVAQTGLRLASRLDLPPGRYQLRVAARESGSGRIGTLNYDLEVPDFNKGPISMSGIVLASASGQQLMTAKPDEELRTVLPAAPTANREFPAGDTIAAYAEVYDNRLQAPHKVDISTTIRSDDGRVVFQTSEERDSSELQGKRGGYGHVVQVPLKDYRPGIYVLRIEAKTRLEKDTPIGREVMFRVR